MEYDFYKMYLEEMEKIPALSGEEEEKILERTAAGEA